MPVQAGSSVLVRSSVVPQSAIRESVVVLTAAPVISMDRRSELCPKASVELIQLAGAGVAAAAVVPVAQQRFNAAYLSALRAAAAMVAMRAPKSGRRISSVWELLTCIAPELGEWARLFQFRGSQRTTAASASARVSTREADDLLRDAAAFVRLVARSLGLIADRPGDSSNTSVMAN